VGKASSKHWDKLRVEIQLRTKMQHAWATAVETVDIFREGELKFGGGADNWRRFFQLSGSAMAMLEGTPCVKNTPSTELNLRREPSELEKKLDVLANLSPWSLLTKHISGLKGGEDYWYFLQIDPEKKEANIESFPQSRFKKANEEYKKAELSNRHTRRQAVLVSINSLTNLEKAYPNYFADTALFTRSMSHFLGK
jgi:hypothetical protein